ncbi:hypothetical protein N781_06415 [Pontibacillus halophilus JSM 076056 = DSM 19796]|uniref:Uncharacterized protein n=1 Tax=Pontibacillus halophilus JSM 076056 = DSM 19796 TaxID=1385510 RepID=A0A0A5GFG9_9BACI|nr:hypothetical protein [Pontibacillus halophilus]KGX90754.1 hypothetical protein N781_06415 [Pontibacillus halophilus JSM 076056 = DSM 19796]
MSYEMYNLVSIVLFVGIALYFIGRALKRKKIVYVGIGMISVGISAALIDGFIEGFNEARF